jgi:signal transduction histidine kinase
LEEHRKTNPSGRGLGLSICKLIVEQMGGEVKVSSVVNEGSIFSIIFSVMCQVQSLEHLIAQPEKLDKDF